ncbi:maleylpyruvate isomerase family mycothiol-dependent enzyme [Nonomuraea zeae]|uniref:Maleylpyruvate isomerase family mycothiol-dependent enzyme n=1 Tax=Nonomuraea zeae TaxID=1642303 RepID=A0A5S4FYP7_9ACTN|nr:maleylpyruvate isomerase family mycothiol-dependent enzyme [Nonomuraea zeae]TMR25828.1 maleylpyruvate isomerase family mycothiol-dependent enzyme [Nonomuraea zeae]
MTTLDPARLAEGLLEQTGGFARAVAGADAGAQVPTCPEWRLADLVRHLGQAHRWAAEQVRKGEPVPVPDPRTAVPVPPGEWAAWLRAGADELTEAIAQTGPDTEVWTILGRGPAVAWLRRMLNETSIHHYDAAVTTGAGFEIADDLAADAVTEAFELISAPGVYAINPALAELRGQGETLALRPDGMEGWLATRTPGGVRWARGDHEADVVMSGPVREIMLVLSRRVPPSAGTVRLHGDAALLDHLLARMAF